MQIKPLVGLSLAALLTFGGIGTAVAVGDNPTPTPGQTLADYMGDDNDAQWDKVQTWIEAEYGEGTTTPVPEPTPDPEPTEEPAGPTLTDAEVVATDDNRIVLTGKVTGVEGKLTFRASANEFGTQAGYPTQVTPAADGTIRAEVEDFNNTDPKYWQLEVGGSTWTHGEVFASGEIGAATPAPEPTTEPTTDPTTEPTEPPATDDHSTDGEGGALTDRTFQSFTNDAGVTSQYHIYAQGLDWSKDVGILVYGDGSAEYGLKNPSSTYLLAGSNGLIAKAKANNMILVTPLAPGAGCTDGDGTCWYQPSSGLNPNQKAKWSADLVKDVFSKYDVHKDRFAFGGYSSGAQWTTQFFGPTHADALMVDGVGVALSYGGSPKSVDASANPVPINYSQEHKDNVVMVWDTGTSDSAYTTTGGWGVKAGKKWYDDNGFETQLHTWSGGHSRSDFGLVMDREIKEHVRPA